MFVVFLTAMAIGFTGMIVASRFALDAAVELVAGTRVPPFVIGMTVLAIGTDLPEIANSIVASWTDHGDVNVGDSLGSSATQMTLVLGLLPLFVGTLVVNTRGLAAPGVLTVIGLGLIALLSQDDWLGRTDAAILIGVWIVGSWLTYHFVRQPHQLSFSEEPASRGRLVIRTVVALVGVAGFAMLALWGLVELAEAWDVPEFVMSFFFAALGTSLPELAFVVTAARRGEIELAIGDVFGSSFVDSTLSVAIGPALFPVGVTSGDILPAALAAMAAIAGATLLITRIREHDWRTGALLLVGYGAFFLVLL